ncbi:FAD-dependent oxidoreductase [uncultured Adlercreutzia sp.]|uniref:FAD-dependent oxidoreductase n=1 Tax=uncultured Adlercreutzia sp. TaxID=875803 RepID=UPI0025A52F5B|nr:FAD-dependent oxidoreductase [uncultured Adlercreutzia sp.]
MALSRRQFIKGTGIIAISLACGGGTLTGCASKTAEDALSTTGSGAASTTVMGFNGEITVSLAVDATTGLISNVSIDGPFETPERGGRAVARLQEALNASGSLEVDTVSGATVTSQAVLDAAAWAKAEALGTAPNNPRLAPGTYTASAHGHYAGIPVTVTVVLSEDTIDAVRIEDGHLETALMARAAEEAFIPRLIEQQSIAVDGATGATMTSSAVRLAVEACLRESYAAAGVGPEAVVPWLAATAYDDAPAENLEADVVVVGLGGAGMAAALSAAERGLSVIALDKAAKYGGTTCVTSESLAVNPLRLSELHNGGATFIDGDALKADWLARTQGDAKKDLLDLFFAESGPTIDWLHFDHQWPFNPPNPGHADYATYDCCFTYEPYTLAGPKVEVAARIDGLMEQFNVLGGEYLLETEATDLLYDTSSERIVGIRACSITGQEYEIAAKSVVLATGGFGENDRLMEQYMIDDFYPLSGTWHQYGMATNDGAMLEQAITLGAATFNPSVPPLSHLAGFPIDLTGFEVHEKDELSFFTGHTALWSEGDIPSSLCVAADGLAVTRQGVRFTNEEEFATHAAIKAGPEYYTIWSQTQLNEFKAQGLRYADPGPSMGYVGCQSTIPLGTPLPNLDAVMDAGIAAGYIFRADSIEELAETVAMEPSVLAQTVADYNRACTTGIDEAFGKNPDYLVAVDGGPYYAILGCAFYYTTAGGLDINERLQVLRNDGTPIQGLYAVGTDSMGVLMTEKDQYLDYGGAASGWAFTSGRLAGMLIAEDLA